MGYALTNNNELGSYLREKRLRLDPAALGYVGKRRRTPGLRREEVAQRAGISPTWYIFLEQGRGGRPSADVLDRVCQALLLTDVEREHAYLLGLGRLPALTYRAAEEVAPRLQYILDALGVCPAVVRTATWDIVAWNKAAALVFSDYGRLPPKDRNVLKLMFLKPGIRSVEQNWETMARFVVAAFRADAARVGATEAIQPLVAELTKQSPQFAVMWRENDVRGFSEKTKTLHHPRLGGLNLEYSSFAVEGRPDLSMLIWTPQTSSDADAVRSAMGIDALSSDQFKAPAS